MMVWCDFCAPSEEIISALDGLLAVVRDMGLISLIVFLLSILSISSIIYTPGMLACCVRICLPRLLYVLIGAANIYRAVYSFGVISQRIGPLLVEIDLFYGDFLYCVRDESSLTRVRLALRAADR